MIWGWNKDHFSFKGCTDSACETVQFQRLRVAVPVRPAGQFGATSLKSWPAAGVSQPVAMSTWWMGWIRVRIKQKLKDRITPCQLLPESAQNRCENGWERQERFRIWWKTNYVRSCVWKSCVKELYVHACHAKAPWLSPTAAPATQKVRQCKHMPCLPHKSTINVTKMPRLLRKRDVHVTKCHSCHTKWACMSASATPAMQKTAASQLATGDQARHQSQPSAVSATPAVHVTKCVTKLCAWQSCERVVCGKVVCDKVVCDKVLCVKELCVWQSSVWQSCVCVRVCVCDKVVCVCEWKNGAWKSSLWQSCVCVRELCLWQTCVWQSCVRRRSRTPGVHFRKNRTPQHDVGKNSTPGWLNSRMLWVSSLGFPAAGNLQSRNLMVHHHFPIVPFKKNTP